MLEVGSIVDGKYKILNEIGHGGMSTVYLAMNERANKTWAVKEVRKTSTTNYEVVRQGLIAETNILKKLSHPNLPSIIDVIDTDDTFLIVMDYIEGQDLQKRLRNGPQPWQYVVNWGIQLCDVLDYLHSQNPPIIYRDMKPANIILKPEGEMGRVMLLDFGTAREYKGNGASADTTCLGTRGYAAPEQYGGQGESDARSDIYTLGATMYHLVTGHMPDEPPHHRMIPIRQWNPALPEGLEAIIRKCTRSNKEYRYQSCKELKYALQHVEEQSETHIRKQRAKRNAFIACLIMTVVFGIATISCRLAANYFSGSEYERLLERGTNYANSGPVTEDDNNYINAKNDFLAAIELQPNRVEAYDALLDLYEVNGGISSAEYNNLDGLAGRMSERCSDADYERFCFELGEYLFFNYTTDSGDLNADAGKKYAVKYLQVASISENLADRGASNGRGKQILAQNLYNIASLSSNLSTNDPLAEYTYARYWDDLVSIDAENMLADVDGSANPAFTTLSIYRMILSEISKHYNNFFEDGVAASEMQEEIDSIKLGLERLDSEFPTLNAAAKELRLRIEDNISDAESKINVARNAEARRG